MNLPITYTPEGLALGDKPAFVNATDGDTPKIQLPVRMLGMDAPELHFLGANENNPGKFDVDLNEVLTKNGANLDNGLKSYLESRLKDKVSTRHIEAGGMAFAHFQTLVDERLKRISATTGKVLRPRKLFTKVATEVFDSYGQMLAYIAPSYTKAERESIPLADRPTFNLQMIQDGHAVSYLIYPNIPKPSDLELIVTATKRARQYKKGIWRDEHSPLHAFEFRWLVRLIRDSDGEGGPSRYCGDFTTGKLYRPQHYYLVPEEYRLFFSSQNLVKALEMGFDLQL